jgi:hypothetical protein
MTSAVDTPASGWWDIDPELAAHILKYHNPRNRKLRESKVVAYEAAMRRGHWRRTGESVIFVGSPLECDLACGLGRLGNGQTRLSACVRARAAFPTLVVTGVDEESVMDMDSGAPRTVGDALTFRGMEGYAKETSEVAKLLLADQLGLNLDAARLGTDIDREQLIQFTEAEYKNLLPALRKGDLLNRRIGMPRRIWGFFFYQISAIDQEMADAFYADLYSGAGLEHDSPLLALRNWVIQRNRPVAGQRPTWTVRLCAIAMRKSWNAWVDDKPLVVIKTHQKEIPELRA